MLLMDVTEWFKKVFCLYIHAYLELPSWNNSVPYKKMEPTYLCFQTNSNEEEIHQIKKNLLNEVRRWNNSHTHTQCYVVVLVPTYDSYHCPHMNVCNFRFIECYCSHSITVLLFVACLLLIHCKFNNIFESKIRFSNFKIFSPHSFVRYACIGSWCMHR